MNWTLRTFFALLDHEPMTNREVASVLKTSIRNVQRAMEKIIPAFDLSFELNEHFIFEQKDGKSTIRKKGLLNKEQVLLLVKILVSSRTLNEVERSRTINAMLDMLDDEERKVIKVSIGTENLANTVIADKSDRQDKLWEIEQYIHLQKTINFTYVDYEMSEAVETYVVDLYPEHTFFDNYYLYLIGREKESGGYKVYRLDWMYDIKQTSVHIPHDHDTRLNHGQEAKYNAYAYTGKKTRIKFEYYGYIGYVKDRFPTCRVIKKLDRPNQFPFSVNLLEIEVNYSAGVKLWLLGQTTILRVVEPQAIAEDIKQTLYNSYKLYDDGEK